MTKILAVIAAYFWAKPALEKILGNFTKTLRDLDILVADKNEAIKGCSEQRAKLLEEEAAATAELRRAMAVRSNIEALIKEN